MVKEPDLILDSNKMFEFSNLKKVVFFLSFIGFCLIGNSQNLEFIEANFTEDKKGLKKALKHLRIGNYFYSRSIYSEAVISFEEAQKINAKNALLNAKIGDCYFHIGKLQKSKEYIESALQLDPKLDGYFVFILAKIEQSNYEFSKAMNNFQAAKNKGSVIDESISERIDKKIRECEYAQELIKTPVNVEITNVGKGINTEGHEYVPLINANESEMFFTSRRKNTEGRDRDGNIDDFYEDIYRSIKKDGVWTEAKNLGAPINTEVHDAAVSLSADGQRLIIYRDDNDGGNLLMSNRKGKNWSSPTKLPAPINSDYQETSATYTPSGKTIYFVSNRPGGMGGMDIYKSNQNDDGTWGEAINLGNVINSIYDEDAVFMHSDGKTLYFSSNGENSMGGFDIFKSTINNEVWSTPTNLGYPVNSTDDDVCFVLSASGEFGYFTSEKMDGEGRKDIYKIKFLKTKKMNIPINFFLSDNSTNQALVGAEISFYDEDKKKIAQLMTDQSGHAVLAHAPKKINQIIVSHEGYQDQVMPFNAEENKGKALNVSLRKSSNTDTGPTTVNANKEGVPFKVLLTDNDTKKGIGNAIIDIYDQEKDSMMSVITDELGNAKLLLVPKRKYRIIANHGGYEEQTILFNSENNRDKPLHINLKKSAGTAPSPLDDFSEYKTIYYDFNKSNIRRDAMEVLNQIALTVKKLPKLKIELSSHTDSRGSVKYNKVLSQKRAESAIDYLVKKGVDRTKIKASSHSEKQLTNQCSDNVNCSELDHQQNRRTEIKFHSDN